MKTLQKILLIIVLISPALYASGQSNTNITPILSNSDSRKKIMTKVANDRTMSDSTMSKEMKEAMMNSVNGKMMMHGNMSMMKTMGDNPEMRESMMSEMIEKCKSDTFMMKSMMSNMMKACKCDTSMISSMCKTMMGDQQMKDMMQKKMGGNKDMKKMEEMDKMKRTGYNVITLPLAAGVLYKLGILLSSAAGAVLMTASTVDDVIIVSIVKVEN